MLPHTDNLLYTLRTTTLHHRHKSIAIEVAAILHVPSHVEECGGQNVSLHQSAKKRKHNRSPTAGSKESHRTISRQTAVSMMKDVSINHVEIAVSAALACRGLGSKRDV